jgi:phage-related holin
MLAKFFVSIPCGIFFFKEEWWKIAYALILIVAVDTILGVWVSVRAKTFSSWRLSRAGSKVAKYFLALVTAYFLSVAENRFEWVVGSLGVFFVLTEAISNFEKLSLLGLTLPTSILAKINDQFKDLYNAQKKHKKEKQKKVTKEILKKP